MKTYDFKEVRRYAEGRWIDVLRALGPQTLQPALEHVGRHAPDPVVGGKDGFRLYADAALTGGAVSNAAGSLPNGFKVLAYVNGWSIFDAVNKVGEFLGVPPRENAAGRGASHLEEPQRPRTIEMRGVLIEAGIKARPTDGAPSRYCVIDCGSGRTRTIWGDNFHRQVRAAGVDFGVPVFIRSVDAVTEAGKVVRGWRIERVSDLDREKAIRSLWERAELIENVLKRRSPLACYLQARSLDGMVDQASGLTDLRFVESAASFDISPSGLRETRWPTMIAAVRDSAGRLTTLHRTYLAEDGKGKAPIDCPKKLMKLPEGRTISGCAVRIGGEPVDGVLGVAEGIETALSVCKAVKLPCWSCVSAGNLQAFDPPAGVQTLVIWADLDRSGTGQKAALALRSRLEAQGIRCVVVLPPMPLASAGERKGWDWNDVLALAGERGFPPSMLFKQQ